MKPGEPVPAGHLLDGRYRVNKVIGQGGMGRVYMANDTRLANRPVAVKEMIVDAGGEQEKKAIEDFQREASVLAALSHPGIPGLFDNFIENGRHYLVMEFVAGGDLQGMLDKLGAGARIAEPKVLRWARQILDVLVFLHSQKPPIIYRDFKPGNIMIDRHGRAMLIDFGIARFLPPGGRGTQIGSVGYAPPEQYMGKAEPRSDLYSLAATTHHLLTGRDPQLEPPFSFPPVRQLAPEVSLQTERVVMRALDREIAKRPASAKEMMDLLPVPPAAAEDDEASPVGAPRVAPAVSAMPTIVLKHPMAGPVASAPASAPKVVSGLKALAGIVSQRRTDPSPAPAPSASAVPAPRAGSRVSSTAKTQDLRPAKSSVSQRSAVPAPSSPARRASAATPRSLRSPAAGPNGRVSPAPAPVTARLISKTEKLEFAVAGERVVIGRVMAPADRSEVGIDLSPLRQGRDRISRRHAEIVKLGRDYFIRDLGSLNGTFISSRGRLGRDQLYKLNDGDEVLLGGTRLEFRKA
jgi:serine/threonine protein kinase